MAGLTQLVIACLGVAEYPVTNGNDDSRCIPARCFIVGHRNLIFRVSAAIASKCTLPSGQSHLVIAGQTAPHDGNDSADWQDRWYAQRGLHSGSPATMPSLWGLLVRNGPGDLANRYSHLHPGCPG
jgi:hypothetical protein